MNYIAVSYERQGTALEKRGNLEIAKEWYIKALKTFELLAKMADTVEHKGFLSDSYTRLGGIEERLENLKKAEEWYEKSLDIDMELVDKAKTPEAERSLFVSVERMGRIYEKQGDIKKAKEWYKGGVSLALKNFEKVKTMESYDDLAMSYFLHGKAGGYMDRNYLTNAFKIWKALSEAFPQVKEFAKRRDLVQQLLNEL